MGSAIDAVRGIFHLHLHHHCIHHIFSSFGYVDSEQLEAVHRGPMNFVLQCAGLIVAFIMLEFKNVIGTMLFWMNIVIFVAGIIFLWVSQYCRVKCCL